MITFRTELQKGVMNLLRSWIGPATDFRVPTFDNHLHDVELDELPFIVVNVRSADLEEQESAPFDTYRWLVHIYYLDTEEDYDIGDARRNKIVGEIIKNLELNKRLGNLESTDILGNREYVYDSQITTALFDSSGQEEYYTFVSELYLDVHSAKT